MTLRIQIAAASFALLVVAMACSTLLGDGPSETDIPNPSVTEASAIEEEPTIEVLASCPVITNRIMEISTSGSGSEEENLLDEEVYLVTYAVSGNEVSNPNFENVLPDLKDEQDDSAAHQQIWNYFTALIPAGQRRIIAEYSIITDGQGGTLAAVAQTQSDPNLWELQVDIADAGNYYDLTYTLVHEFGHLLTLSPDQVPPSLAVFNNPDDEAIYLDEASACPDYFPGEGCANPDSYINDFYRQFWADIYEEWNELNLEENDDAYYEKLDEFYYKYEDQFLTSYAAANPEEDIAEAWAFFIFSPEPAGDSIAEEKVLFFYQYPELVELRTNILSNICMVFPK